jgi:hypothetical protein
MEIVPLFAEEVRGKLNLVSAFSLYPMSLPTAREKYVVPVQ